MEPVRVPSIPEKTELVRTDAYFDDEALYLNLGLIRSPSKRVSVWRVFQAKSSRSESAVYVGDARFSERPCCPRPAGKITEILLCVQNDEFHRQTNGTHGSGTFSE